MFYPHLVVDEILNAFSCFSLRSSGVQIEGGSQDARERKAQYIYSNIYTLVDAVHRYEAATEEPQEMVSLSPAAGWRDASQLLSALIGYPS